MMVRLTKEIVNKRLTDNGRGFSLIGEYLNGRVKSLFECECGHQWMTRVENVFQGTGCPKCSGIDRPKTKMFNAANKFIPRAISKHIGKYDYSLVEYRGVFEPVKIICPKHGVFNQKPTDHLSGKGCQACGNDVKGAYRKKTTIDFISEARMVHGASYNYDNVIYLGNHKKIIITCESHGDFQQTPAHHLHGTGCPSCADSGFNKGNPAILYYLKINSGEAYKIGITNRTIEERFNNADLSKIEILMQKKFSRGEDAAKREKDIKSEYREFKYNKQALLSSGNTELFSVDILGMDRGSVV